jgi:hypothetical protein
MKMAKQRTMKMRLIDKRCMTLSESKTKNYKRTIKKWVMNMITWMISNLKRMMLNSTKMDKTEIMMTLIFHMEKKKPRHS